MTLNISINSIVAALCDNLEEGDKRRFLLDRDAKSALVKNVECFYLSGLCSEFKIFSELDLLLMSYGCKISIWIDSSVPFVPCRLPRDIGQRVLIKMDEDGRLIVEMDGVLSYTPGRFNEVLDFVREVDIPATVALPKALKEPSSPLEDDSATDVECLREYNGELKFHYDVDGICGFIPDHIASPFFNNLSLCVNIKENPQIFTKSLVHMNKPIKDFIQIKLGTIDSHLGQISLFTVFNTDEEVDLDLFLKNIGVLVEEKPRENSEISCGVSSDEVPGFLGRLKYLYPGTTLFVECYGSKGGHNNKIFASVYMGLYTIFNSELIQELSFDIAVSVTPTDTKILFIDLTVFERLHVRPNYRLALCNNMANYNDVKISADGVRTIYSYGCVGKVNFYSLLEDMVVGLRKTSFLPVVSLKRAQQNLEGLIYKKGKESTFEKKISTVKSKMNQVYRLGYRLEMSTKGLHVASVFNLLTCVATQSKYFCLSYARFKFIFLSNLNYINSLISGNSLNDLFNSISAEMTLKEAYIKGTVNKHFLPASYNLTSFFSNRGITRLESSFKEAISIDRDSGVTMVNKLITASPLKFLKPGFVELLKTFIFISSSNNLPVCIFKVYMQYVNDYTKYYKLEEAPTMNYRRLGVYIALLRENEESISLNSFLQTNFLGEKPRKAMLPYVFLMDFVKSKFGLTDEALLDLFYSMIKNHGLNVAWVHLSRPERGSKVLILLDEEFNSIGGHNKTVWLELLNQQTKLYLAQRGVQSFRPKKVKWTDGEQVRLLNALIRYSTLPNKFGVMFTDFVYGFYLTRTALNALSDGWRTISKKATLMELLKEAVVWKPEYFPMVLHFDGFEASDAIMDSYASLYRLDSARYRAITVEDITSFNATVMDGQLSEEVLAQLFGLVETHEVVRPENEFKNAIYKPFDEGNAEIVLVENWRPMEISLPLVVPEIGIDDSQNPSKNSLPARLSAIEESLRDIAERLARVEDGRLVDRQEIDRLERDFLGLGVEIGEESATRLSCSTGCSNLPLNEEENADPASTDFVLSDENRFSPTYDSLPDIATNDDFSFSPTYDDDAPVLEDSKDFKLNDNNQDFSSDHGPHTSPITDDLQVSPSAICSTSTFDDAQQTSLTTDDLRIPLSANVTSSCDLTFNEKDVLEILKKKFYRKSFTVRESLRLCFGSKKRPSTSTWSAYLNRLVSTEDLAVKQQGSTIFKYWFLNKKD